MCLYERDIWNNDTSELRDVHERLIFINVRHDYNKKKQSFLCTCDEVIWGSVAAVDSSTVAPLILKLDLDASEWWAWHPGRFIPRERASGNHWRVGVRHSAGLDNCDSLL